MSHPQIDPDLCTACGTCVDDCPNGCLALEATAVLAHADDCTECGTCADSCPNGAITV